MTQWNKRYDHFMRIVLALVVAVCACGGPSNAEIKTAKTAHYSASPQALFEIAVSVASQDYKIGQVDQANAHFMTEPQMYSPEGGRQSEGAGGFIQMNPGSILLAMFVEVVPHGRDNMVVVTPKTFQVISGSPKPRELAPDDPNIPGWVHGRVDALAVAIYNGAKQHAVP